MVTFDVQQLYLFRMTVTTCMFLIIKPQQEDCKCAIIFIPCRMKKKVTDSKWKYIVRLELHGSLDKNSNLFFIFYLVILWLDLTGHKICTLNMSWQSGNSSLCSIITDTYRDFCQIQAFVCLWCGRISRSWHFRIAYPCYDGLLVSYLGNIST